jgi:glutamine---fructose-6-phosphate transaminase (isomerizing)
MKSSTGDRQMLAEILNQPAAWEGTIGIVGEKAERLRELCEGREEVVFTGCGSGLNAATAMAPAFQRVTGIRARAVPAAEIVFFPETVLLKGSRSLVVPISRSGATTETVLARDAARDSGLPTLAVTCDPESPLARESSEALVLSPAAEESVTTTQSLTSMVLCGQLLAAAVAEDDAYRGHLARLPECGRRIMERMHELGRGIGENPGISRYAFVGSGSLIGLARECQLKIKEMVLQPSDSYPLLDYRHGPKSNVDESMLVTVLTTDRTRKAEAEFVTEMKGLGGKLLVACERPSADLTGAADWFADVDSGLPDFARDILYMPVIHFLAYYASLARGLSPSTPKNLTYWVATTSLGGPGGPGRAGSAGGVGPAAR